MPQRRLLGVLRPHRARVALLLVLIVALAATTVAPAVVAQRLIDHGVLRRDEGMVWAMTGALAALGAAQAALTYLERRFATRLAEDVVLRLRTDVFAHLQRQSLGFFSVPGPAPSSPGCTATLRAYSKWSRARCPPPSPHCSCSSPRA
ncbi:ABC transporter [Streptomyces alboflavus]|uniref:ABC transporter n=1 Tax=Streptomyces alboflavus TaxID=67267 RepID=A0A1Z1WSL2_9ACTN|nr:ABC transporter transmembrane domain-containing protein [Streptomyces alboflavus]ARX89397.1 ABC transporter [Streptomyces alboflavus]